MSLTLYFHPLSSFCMKVLTALYENDTPFTPHLVDLMDETAAANLRKMWPIGKFPVLRDETRGATVTETSIIIEFLQLHYPGPVQLIPQDGARALQMRLRDRMFDLYLNMQMQKVVGDRLRPAGQKDPQGVAEARNTLDITCSLVDKYIDGKTWITGDDFTMADCAAAPALFYTDKVMPLAENHKNAAAYLERLMQRPSFARVLKEAEPYFKLFPQDNAT
ncbi:glutathione S-transferase family protein [Pseudorhodoplanes sinuspersici]|uniref:Glutathione S-transferase n=1 Tax=Pseudorhodoplanes sinuspersici TaxID=1235591 RepID=A0A1W7A008_9HYPH|nr:glutathione S-transferase family protein [Pseudorhodoplanes sinuspersici]ARQ02910.1 glutathione S-transferase [Pseudorhodoplanes sinuspersici]RKE70706.1 glutathione S-transferase [Pseudorhodoplanes sinuspersici]